MLPLDLHVLVVEDNESVLDFLSTYFRKRGIQHVYEARTGTEAWELCACKPINFIVSDWNMPEMSGLELLKNVRAMWSGIGEVPFIMVTSQRQKDQILKAGQAEVDDYLVKPFRASLLEKRFEEVLLKKMFNQYVALAFLDVAREKFDVALEKFRRAFTENNSNSAVLCGLVISYVSTGNMNNAANYFAKLREQDEGPLLLYTKGVFYNARDTRDSSAIAIESLLKCIKMDPSFYRAYILSVQIDINLGKVREAKRTLDALSALEIPYLNDRKTVGMLAKKLSEVLWDSSNQNVIS